ncbi:MAG: DUF3667 domain-containing protein [Chitinophagales bacterium]
MDGSSTSDTVVICKNCQSPVNGNYCAQCGQAADTHDINAHFLWHDIQHGLFHFDSGIFYTLKELMIRPGNAIREFIEGKRVRHFKPISFLVIIAGLYGFLAHWQHVGSHVELAVGDGQKTVSQVKQVMEWLINHYAFLMLLLLPFSAFGTYRAFYASGYNYAKHLVINAYMQGWHIVIKILFMPLTLWLIHDPENWLLTLPEIISIGYVTFTLMQLFHTIPARQRLLRVLWSYILTGLLYVLFFIVAVALGLLWVQQVHPEVLNG